MGGQQQQWMHCRVWAINKFNKAAKVRIAERGWNNRESSAGIAISQVMIKNFFGFYPQINAEPFQDVGTIPFTGKLYNVFYGGNYYTISYSNGRRNDQMNNIGSH